MGIRDSWDNSKIKDYNEIEGSQTSDNMDRWKSRGGKSQRKKTAEQRRSEEKESEEKKMQVREKVEKSQKQRFSTDFVAPESRKVVGSLKRRVQSQLTR